MTIGFFLAETIPAEIANDFRSLLLAVDDDNGLGMLTHFNAVSDWITVQNDPSNAVKSFLFLVHECLIAPRDGAGEREHRDAPIPSARRAVAVRSDPDPAEEVPIPTAIGGGEADGGAPGERDAPKVEAVEPYLPLHPEVPTYPPGKIIKPAGDRTSCRHPAAKNDETGGTAGETAKRGKKRGARGASTMMSMLDEAIDGVLPSPGNEKPAGASPESAVKARKKKSENGADLVEWIPW